MNDISIGDSAPDFCLPDMSNNEICLSVLRGKLVVLYFYPRDNTPACTIEAKSFTDNIERFKEHNAIVVGISPDSCESHKKFADKKNLGILLLSDPMHIALEKYGVWKQKKLLGVGYSGVERTTFLISEDGFVNEVWRKVKVTGHAEEILKKIISGSK